MTPDDTSQGTSLGARQERLLAALLTEGDIASACEAARVSRSTAMRALRDPAFQEALRAAESERLREATRVLVTLGAKAARVLEKALDDAEAPMAARVRAADIALTKLLALRTAVDVEARLTALEAALAQEKVGEIR
jgi:hypothetical protein